jgi:hypothetical protein
VLSLLAVSGADATRAQLVQLENNSTGALQLYAPLADLDLANNSRLIGSLVGRSVTLRSNQILSLPL